ncbi:MAG: hypothetical protein ACRD4Y_08755, partial [Candidatus Acidiferrales bacterium]
NMLVRVTQQDVVYRRFFDPSHRSHIPDFGVFIQVQTDKGDMEYRAISRQLVLFCVERRKAWRMLQSKTGIENKEYQAQRSILADVDSGKIPLQDFFARAEELLKERIAALSPAPAPAHKPAPAAAAPAPARVVAPAKPAPAAPKPPAEVAKQPVAVAQKPAEPKVWAKPPDGDGDEYVIDIGICPLCEEMLHLAYPHAVDVGGQLVHATCAVKILEKPTKN